MPHVHRLNSPFAHWVSGLLIELIVFAAFIAVCALTAFVLATLA